MYKIKLFSENKMQQLQGTINEWLQSKKDILIHSSNLTSSNSENLGSNEYSFYVLYSGPDEQDNELKEIAAAVTSAQSIDAKEINPEILKASS